MRRSIVVGTVLVFAGIASAHADFDYVGAIPAPQAPYGSSKVTGLSAAGANLFAVVRSDTTSFLFLLRPEDGQVLRQAEFADEVPCGHGRPPQFMSGAAYDVDNDVYVVGDACGAFLEVEFGAGGTYVLDHYFVNEVETPSGLVFEGDTMYTVDWDDDVLVKAVGTLVLGEYPLPVMDSPAAVTLYRGNLLVASSECDSLALEITKQAALVETHHVHGLTGCAPHAATFIGDRLYLAGPCGSILIFESSDQGIWVPGGGDVPIEVIPGELSISFDSVSTAGWLYAGVYYDQVCPAPEGVQLYPPFYELNTTAQFDYVASLDLTFTDSLLPPDYPIHDLRIFRRPSGPCQEYKDVTIDSVEVVPVLIRILRTRSEDDEFSVFALGIDSRRPRAVVEVKFTDLSDIVYSNEGVIPPDVFGQISAMLVGAESAYYRGLSLEAEAIVKAVAQIVRDTDAIPHTFDGTPGSNVAGGIISTAHTLAFSLRHSDREQIETTAEIKPHNIIVGLGAKWVKAFLEVPAGFDVSDVDSLNIYLEAQVHAVPDSVRQVDYDADGVLEVRALFPWQDVEEIFTGAGPATVEVTTFVDGFELHALAGVDVYMPTVEIMGEEPFEAGHTYKVKWPAIFEEPTISYALYCTLDRGLSWDEIATGIERPYYYWRVPDVETDAGMLRLDVVDEGIVFLDLYSNLFSIASSSAGVPEDVRAEAAGLTVSPNPSRPPFQVRLSASGGEVISVRIYSVSGELVRTLVERQAVDGVRSLTWQGDNKRGLPVAAGTYFIVLKEGDRETVTKLILQR